MTEISLCNKLRRYLTLSTPSTAITNLTVVALNGNTVQLSGTVGTTDQWVGGVLEITQANSPAYLERAIIMGNSGAVVTLHTQFDKSYPPQVGDTVRVFGGPLSEARIYLFEPDSIESAIKANKKYFVVINCVSGETEQITLGTANRGIHTAENVYDIEIAVETPDLVGTPTEAETKRISVELPTLRQQVVCVLHWFRNQASNNATGRGTISFAYFSYQRTGSPIRLRGAVLQFEIAAR